MYDAEDRKRIEGAFLEAIAKVRTSGHLYLTHKYRTESGLEFAHHGYVRRLAIMMQCLDNVFELIPLDLNAIPNKKTLLSATINIQACILNAFGAVDNLARIWVSEADVKDKKGAELGLMLVGLRAKNEYVRQSFSDQFQKTIAEFDPWFEYLTSYRDGLAHRIPLYIPPFTLPDNAADEYRELQQRIDSALLCRDYAEHDRLSKEAGRFGVFKPWIMHSFGDAARPVAFHPQMMSDIITVCAIGEAVYGELRALPSPAA